MILRLFKHMDVAGIFKFWRLLFFILSAMGFCLGAAAAGHQSPDASADAGISSAEIELEAPTKEVLLAIIKKQDTARLEAFLTEHPHFISMHTPADTGYALHYAVAIGNPVIVAKLLAAKAHVNAEQPEANIRTPLEVAVTHGFESIVKMLIEAGAQVNKKHPLTKQTALHRAVLARHRNIVALLLAHGAVKEVLDVAGKSAKDYAIALALDSIVELL